MGTLKDISSFSVLLLICIYTYTLLGMELFANRMKFDKDGKVDLLHGESPRRNFDTFLLSFSSIFNILQGEDWNLIMIDASRAVGEASIIFFVTLVILG